MPVFHQYHLSVYYDTCTAGKGAAPKPLSRMREMSLYPIRPLLYKRILQDLYITMTHHEHYLISTARTQCLGIGHKLNWTGRKTGSVGRARSLLPTCSILLLVLLVKQCAVSLPALLAGLLQFTLLRKVTRLQTIHAQLSLFYQLHSAAAM